MLLAVAAFLAQAQACPASCWKAQGIEKASRGDYAAAESAFAQACRMDSTDPDACYYWGRALFSLQRFEDSLKALERAPEGGARGWRVPTARGQAYDALGRATEAEKEFKKALAARRRDSAPPAEPDPLTSYTAFLYRQGRIKEAALRLEDAPVAYRNLAAYQYQLGRALAQQEKWDAAAAALSRAVGIQPDYVEAHALLSRVYFRLGKADLGEEHARLGRQRSTTSR